MLTKAIIQNIDYTKNICKVRIPLFETASRNVSMIEADAQFSIVPGVYNSYKTGDVVFIGFEENKMELPVILGKLFVSASAEAGSYRGNLSGNSLSITDTAQLPYSTIFNYDKISQNKTVYKDLNTPKKLADSIINLQLAQAQKYQTIIEVTVDESTSYKLYLKTSNDFTYSSGGSEETLYRLCTALKKSQAKNSFIPLDSLIIESVVNKGLDQEAVTYQIQQAFLHVQEFDSYTLKLIVVFDEKNYEVNKDNISQIQSVAIYY